MSLKSNIRYQFILVLISPVLSLLNAFRSKNEKFITFAGTLFMGIAGSVYVYSLGNDGVTHLERIGQYYMAMSLNDFFQESFKIITFKSIDGSTDMYMHIMAFIAGSVFKLPELLHVMAGLVLGYFYTKSVILLLRHRPLGEKSILLIAFIALFLIIRSLTALNSIRMWTAMWVLFYGSYSWILTKKKKYLLVTLMSVFFHFSYAIILIPLVTAFLLKGDIKSLCSWHRAELSFCEAE